MSALNYRSNRSDATTDNCGYRALLIDANLHTRDHYVCIDEWRVKVRNSFRGLPSYNKKYYYLREGLPDDDENDFPQSVSLFLWGGLSAYTQDLELKKNNRIRIAFHVVFMIPVMLLFVEPFMLDQRLRDYYLSVILLFCSAFCIFRFWVKNVYEQFDNELRQITTDIIAPVFREEASCELNYVSVNGIFNTYSFYSIKSLMSNTVEIEKGFNKKDNKVYNCDWPKVLHVPVYEYGCVQSLEYGVRPPELESAMFDMFAWGALFESVQKINQPIRKQERLYIIIVWCALLLAFIATVLTEANDDNPFIYLALNVFGVIFIFLFSTCFGSCLITYKQQHADKQTLHDCYASALADAIPIIAERTAYTMEYVVENEGLQSHVLLRLKDQEA